MFDENNTSSLPSFLKENKSDNESKRSKSNFLLNNTSTEVGVKESLEVLSTRDESSVPGFEIRHPRERTRKGFDIRKEYLEEDQEEQDASKIM